AQDLGEGSEDRHPRHARHRGSALLGGPDRRDVREAGAYHADPRGPLRAPARGRDPRVPGDGPSQAGVLGGTHVRGNGGGQTIRGFGEIFTQGYAGTLLVTLRQLVVGFVIALVIAIPVGVLMGRFRFVEDILAPYVNTLFVTPKQALLPVIIVAVGVGFWYR